jgi:hypothetical protein
MNVNIHPWARADIRRRIDYLEKEKVSLQVLEDFDAAIRQALDKIAAQPTTWSFAAGSTKIRKVQIAQFRMQAFYGIPGNGVPLVVEFAGPGVQPRWPRRLRRIDPII